MTVSRSDALPLVLVLHLNQVHPVKKQLFTTDSDKTVHPVNILYHPAEFTPHTHYCTTWLTQKQINTTTTDAFVVVFY